MSVKPNVVLLSYPADALKIACDAAARCYSGLTNEDLVDFIDNKDRDDLRKYINGVINTGHLSTIEHVSYTFMIEGVSRAFLAQISRHRLASFSVQSQRYVKLDGDGEAWYIMPPAIESREECKEIFLKHMSASVDAYNKLCDILIAAGRTDEQAQEDARFVLPEATQTRMVVTMNARELMHFFNMRCCNRAQWEIRSVANKMLSLVKQATPELMKKAGASCAKNGVCPEGKRSCGHPQYADPKKKLTFGNQIADK